MKLLNKAIRRLVKRAGFDIVRTPRTGFGVDPFADMQRFVGPKKRPVIFDIGANVGQSADRFHGAFPSSCIHCFEPSPATFIELKKHCDELPGVSVWNCGVGSCDTTLSFHENEHSVMSSFLKLNDPAWGRVVGATDVKVIALDSFARTQDIEFIHVLKSDTQGYEFEVFKGARQLMRENRIGLIYFEFIFSEMYADLPSFQDVFGFLSANNFVLVTFYELHFERELASWTDALFINRDYYRNRMKQGPAADVPPGVSVL